MKNIYLRYRQSKFTYVILAFVFMAAYFVSPFGVTTSWAIECTDEVIEKNRLLYDSQDIIWSDPCEVISTDTCTTATSSSVFNNNDYAGNTIFSEAQLKAIEENKPFYEKAASANGIPWQLMAAIHQRETGLRRYGPANGYGPFQITPSDYPISSAYTDQQFQDAANAAAAFIKARIGGRDISDPNTIKSLLFAYNGMAGVYKTQALKLGFTQAEADIGEGSPYVMNRFDLKRDGTVEPTRSNRSWGQIQTDYGAIAYPARTDYGAFVYYSALSNGSLCTPGGAAVGQNGDANALQKAFTDYMNRNGGRYGLYNLDYNGCTTLASWFIGEYTTLTYGRGHGKDVVSGLAVANLGKLGITNKPTAPAIFSVAGGLKMKNIWGASGVPEGHVGVVISVDESAQTATVVHTGSLAANEPQKAWVDTFSFPQEGVTFTNIGDYMK